MPGFGNNFVSEHPLYPGAVHEYRNIPQKCKYGLYAEAINGTAMTGTYD